MKRRDFLKQSALSAAALAMPGGVVFGSGQEEVANLSKVPRYRFADTLAEQEKQLKDNPLLERFRRSREKLHKDPHVPLYHFVSPEHRLNDPNGLCFWQGLWHMFYQGYPPEDPRQHWGHVVSEDLIHWRDLPYAIYPGPERACFSGSALVDGDRVIAMYHGTTVGSMVAVSSDPLLLNWKKVTGKAVIPHSKPGEPRLPYNIFDPCIWKKHGVYYALTAGTLPNGPGGKRVRAEFLHRSEDLAKWEYMHPFLEDDRFGIVGGAISGSPFAGRPSHKAATAECRGANSCSAAFRWHASPARCTPIRRQTLPRSSPAIDTCSPATPQTPGTIPRSYSATTDQTSRRPRA